MEWSGVEWRMDARDGRSGDGNETVSVMEEEGGGKSTTRYPY